MMAGTAEVGTLRVRSAAGDTPAVRLAASAWLGGADLHPGGLPPSAVLIVRRMADPLPGKLPSGGPTPPDPAWERAARASLDDFRRRAARPAGGPVPPDAEAVLFADEAEMLACLALDLARGNAPGRWWWRLVVRRRGARDLPTLLAAEPARLPAVFHHLAQWHRAAEMCESLSAAAAAAILDTMARAHGALDLAKAVTSTPPGTAGVPPAGGRVEKHGPRQTAADAQIPETPDWSPPSAWQRRLRAIPDAARLQPAQRALLAAGLALFEEPGRARSAAFASEVRAWWEGGAGVVRAKSRPEETENRVAREGRAREVGPSPPIPLSHPHSLPPGEGAPPPEKTRAWREAARRLEGPPPGLPPDPTLPLPGGRDARSTDRGESGAGSETEPIASGEAQASAGAEPAAVETSPVEARRGAEPVEVETGGTPPVDESEETEEAAAAFLEEGVATEIAGLFYLINLMTSLDIPDRFEEDWHLASEFGAWCVLEAIARALLGDAGPLAADPVWRLLALLDGRELQEKNQSASGTDRNAPGTGHDAPGHRGADLGTDHAAPGTDGAAPGRDDDAPGTDDDAPGQMVADLGTALRGRGPGGEGLQRWLAFILPALRLRLAQGLGLDPARPEDLPPLLLLHPGRVHATTTHVDVVMDLASISMPVRVSGLDRDPGWLPAFGRVVQFHFH